MVGTYAIFGLNGLVFASWAGRLPSVAITLDLTPGGLGLLLLMIGLGSVLGLPLAGVIVDRFGTAVSVRLTGSLIGLSLLVIAVSLLMTWLVPVAIALFFFGFGVGVWDVSQNIEGAEVERRIGRTIMPKFHAAFSGGAFVGALIGSLMARIGVGLPVHLFGVVALGAVVVFLCTRVFLPATAHAEHTEGPAEPRRRTAAWREPRTLVIGLVVLGAAFTEGAANDWVAKATVDGLGASESAGAIMFGVFVAAMTGFRFAGSALLDRLGRVAVLRICLTAAILGLVLFVFAPNIYLAAVGAVLWGIGAALGFPVGMSAAADEPRYAAGRVAVVSTIGYAAFLMGPPLLGFIGNHVGVRHSLLAVAVVVLASLLTTSAVQPKQSAVVGADVA
ncbi:MFS transporter [Microlunatus panaciterrae]